MLLLLYMQISIEDPLTSRLRGWSLSTILLTPVAQTLPGQTLMPVWWPVSTGGASGDSDPDRDPQSSFQKNWMKVSGGLNCGSVHMAFGVRRFSDRVLQKQVRWEVRSRTSRGLEWTSLHQPSTLKPAAQCCFRSLSLARSLSLTHSLLLTHSSHSASFLFCFSPLDFFPLHHPLYNVTL